MKTIILVIILIAFVVGLFTLHLEAQTSEQWVTQGLSELSAKDIIDANASFAQALAVSSTNEDANALYAITRLLALPYQPAGSNFLTRIGLPAAGRNIYGWTAKPPVDTNGLLLAPAGVNADEFTAQLRTNVLFAVAGAISNLDVVSDTNYSISLTSGETSMAAVTVDYGDLELIRAGLYATEYLIYTLNAENLNAQLTDLRALYTSGDFSVSRLLADYPQLFTFATTNDLADARMAFTNAVNDYMAASAFIRARPPGEVRLFNYDEISAQSEADFRLTLQDLENSILVGPQYLTLAPDVAVDMSVPFDGSMDLRNLLPKFYGNDIALGSLPDSSFDGLVNGLTTGQVESFLSKRIVMLPVGSPPRLLAGNTVELNFTTLSGHYYVLGVSTNLVDWNIATNFTATDSQTTLLVAPPAGSRSFYVLRDDSAFMVFAGVVLSATTGQPIAGAQILSEYDGSSTYSGANGQFYLLTTLSANGNDSDQLLVSAAGYASQTQYFYGSGIFSGLQFSLNLPPPNDDFANRITLTGGTTSYSGNNSGATYEAGDPYPVYYGKSVWFTWTAPSTGSYQFSVESGFYYPVVAAYTGTQLSSLVNVGSDLGSGYNASITISATANTTYQIGVDDQEEVGGAYTLYVKP